MKIIRIKNKKNEWPLSWIELCYCKKEKMFFFGGAPLIVVKDAKQAQKVMYKARKYFKKKSGIELNYYTKEIELWNDKGGEEWIKILIEKQTTITVLLNQLIKKVVGNES